MSKRVIKFLSAFLSLIIVFSLFQAPSVFATTNKDALSLYNSIWNVGTYDDGSRSLNLSESNSKMKISATPDRKIRMVCTFETYNSGSLLMTATCWDYDVYSNTYEEVYGNLMCTSTALPSIITAYFDTQGFTPESFNNSVPYRMRLYDCENTSYLGTDNQIIETFSKQINVMFKALNQLVSDKTGKTLGYLGFNYFGTINTTYEPNNNTKNGATLMSLGTRYTDEIGNYSYYITNGRALDEDYWKVYLQSGRNYRINIEGYTARFASESLIIRLMKPNDTYTSIGGSMARAGVDYYDFTPTESGYYYIRLYNYFDLTKTNDTSYVISVIDCNAPTSTPRPTATNTSTPTSTPMPHATLPPFTPSSGTGDVDSFLGRLYTVVLGREEDAAGKAFWLNKLNQGTQNGGSVAKSFLESDEFIRKNYTDEDFLEVLYRLFFNRDSDERGRTYWLNAMSRGYSRSSVIQGFINSNEWATICRDYGIESGGTGVPNPAVLPPFTPSSGTGDVDSFLGRLYTVVLGREEDAAGKAFWLNKLNQGTQTGGSVAKSFLESREFTLKNYTNEDFIEVLYRLFFNRDSDERGRTYWLNAMNRGYSRSSVIRDFINSNEWATICRDYGIESGGTGIPAPAVLPEFTPSSGSGDVDSFLGRLYTVVLGREEDAAGKAFWLNKLNQGTQNGGSVARAFLESREFTAKNYTDEDFLEILYRLFFNRDSDERGRTYWLNAMSRGYSRSSVIQGFINSNEWATICRDYGIESGGTGVPVDTPTPTATSTPTPTATCTPTPDCVNPIVYIEDSVVYTLIDNDENGDFELLRISGSGATSSTYREEFGDVTTVMIEEGITEIGDETFNGCSALTIVEIHAPVTSIGADAFANSGVISIDIPDSVISIGDGAFYRTMLTSIEIPDSVTSIGAQAFEECVHLTSVKLSSSITRIEDATFVACFALASIEIPDSVTSIGKEAFISCRSMTTIRMSDSVTMIEEKAFEDCRSLIAIELPESIVSIGKEAFSGCSSLESIDIPNSVTLIGEGAFAGCSSITSIVILSSVASTGDYAFYGCSSVSSIYLPNTLLVIGEGAFGNCTSLTSIEIPESVVFIGNNSFNGCSSLQDVVILNSNVEVGYSAFNGCPGAPDYN